MPGGAPTKQVTPDNESAAEEKSWLNGLLIPGAWTGPARATVSS